MISGKRPRGVVRTHVIPFEDHAGQPALTVFKSSSSLPFLYSFSFYFTHPDASPDTSHAAELYNTLTRGSIYDTNDVEFRLDLYFLPNANQDDCIAHYRAEKDARGTYQAQVDAVASGDAQPPSAGDGGGGSRLPGLVVSYVAHNKSRFAYHGLLHICDVADWREGDQLLSRVEFDPLSREDYERYYKDPGDPREPDVLPETEVRPEALTEDSPGHGRELPRPYFGVRALEKTLWERVPKQRHGQEARDEARDRGWTTWRAFAVIPIKYTEIQFSLWGTEMLTNGVAAAAKECNVSLLTYAPLGYGFLCGAVKKLEGILKRDIRHEKGSDGYVNL